MVTAIELKRELEEKGGILNILKSYLNKLENLAKKATEIWRKAFRSTRTITYKEIGRYYGLFKGIYRRARPETKKRLEPYMKEFEKIYREYKKLTRNIDLSKIEYFVRRGEFVYNLPKVNYRVFLYNLHEWLSELYLYFMVRKKQIEPIIPDIYKFIDKMVHIIIDVTTEYTGEKPVPGSFEFILSCFIHIENFVHESPEAYEPLGPLSVAEAYLLEILEKLVDEYDYIIVYPGYHIGVWVDHYYSYPQVPSGTEAESEVKTVVLDLASQIGIDVKNDLAILEYLEQKFPAYFLIYDHYRGRERRSAKALLPWDFLKLPIDEIIKMFK